MPASPGSFRASEPVVTSHAATVSAGTVAAAAVTLAQSYGAPISADQGAAIVLLVVLLSSWISALVARQKVRPVPPT